VLEKDELDYLVRMLEKWRSIAKSHRGGEHLTNTQRRKA